MKRILLFAFCLCLSSILFAASPLKIARGEYPQFKKGDQAILVIDMSNTTWEEKESFGKHFEEYDKLEDLLYEVFLTTYNRNSKTIHINGEGNPNYRFVFRPEDFFCSVDGAFFKKNTRVWGTLSILEEDSRNEICVVQIIGFPSAESDYVEADSVIKCISNLAKTLTRRRFWNMFQDDIYM